MCLALLPMLYYACAQIVAPNGGPEDEIPPQLDTLGSTPNLQTNFTKQDIILTFDEWIELKKVNDQVLISPEITDYDIRVKKKSVIFSFGKETELLENITYIINFGESVVDFTEGNPVPNLRMVFSTGSFIDSLTYSGTVVDALTGKPVDKAVVMLHDNLSDTAVTTVKPLYVTRTNKSGVFRLQNLKSDTFQVFALLEKFSDYKYDPLTESIAFLDSVVILSDKTTPDANLVLSESAPALLRKNTDLAQFGRLAIAYNQKPEAIEISADPPRAALYSQATPDSLIVWYNSQDTIDWNLMLKKDSTYLDTIPILASKISDEFNLDVEPQPKIPAGSIQTNPFEPFKLNINFPITKIDSSKISLQKDSAVIQTGITLEIDSTDSRKLRLERKLQEGNTYKLTLLPGALISIHQRSNDTLSYNLKMQTLEDFSNLSLNITQLDSSSQYIFTLKNKADKIIDKKLISDLKQISLKYPHLAPGDYSATIVIDQNYNGQWDTGNFELRRQPEKIVIKDFGKFLANFDREEDWLLPIPEK